MDIDTQAYKERVAQVAFNVADVVLPMDKLPENLMTAYQSLLDELVDDKEGEFTQAWDGLPASAQKLLARVEFHGFYIANAWLQLSRVAQDIAERADTDDAIEEHEYNDVFVRLAQSSLKESVRKLKKARTDRALLNGIKQVIG